MLQRGGRIGAGGIFCASFCYARRQVLRMFAAPRYPWWKRWCVAIIMLRSVKYARGYLPSVKSISSCASGVLMGVAIRSPGKGGPFGILLTARRLFSATLSGGGGGVAGGRFGPIRAGWSCGVPECLSDPSCAVWRARGSLQKVPKVEDVIHQSVTQGGSVLGRWFQGEAQTGSAPWSRVRAVFTSDASFFMGSRRPNGKCLFLNINLEMRRSG